MSKATQSETRSVSAKTAAQPHRQSIAHRTTSAVTASGVRANAQKSEGRTKVTETLHVYYTCEVQRAQDGVSQQLLGARSMTQASQLCKTGSHTGYRKQ